MTMTHISNPISKRDFKPRANSFEGLPKRAGLKKTRLFVDNEYLEKGYCAIFPESATKTYLVLLRHANHDTQVCYPSYETIMEKSGIKNRSTVSKALKILEAHDLIAVIRSRPNRYLMLDSEYWKEPNSPLIETIQHRNKVSTVKAQSSEPLPQDSNPNETQSHISKSSNEVKENISIKEETPEPNQTPTSQVKLPSNGTYMMLQTYFYQEDIDKAVAELRTQNFEPTASELRKLLKSWAAQGKIKPIKPMVW